MKAIGKCQLISRDQTVVLFYTLPVVGGSKF